MPAANHTTHNHCNRACLAASLTLAAASPLLSPTLPGATAGATNYTFVNIADSSGPLGTNFGWPDINDDGTVTFWNIHDDGTTTAIYTGDGGPLTQQVNNQGIFDHLEFAPVINNSNEVAFWAEKASTGARGIYKVLNGVVTLVADETISLFYDFDYLPSINDSGEVSYSGNLYLPCCGSAVGVGAAVAYDPSGPFISFFNDVTINNNGVVAFGASYDGFAGSGIFTGTGGPFTTIATIGSMFTSISIPPNINDSGAVAFHGVLAGGVEGLFIGSGGPITTISTTAGPFNDFGPNGAAFNNNGDVAFFAILDAGSATGIFTGPDPATDTVIKAGDPLFGSTVYGGLNVVRGLNNHGDIAFTYVLHNASGGAGLSGVAVALAQTAPGVPADLDGDGDVDGFDLAQLLGQWTGAASYSPCPPHAPADLNSDCKVNGFDLALLLGAWG